MPEKIENIYIKSQFIEQVFVHGESLKSCIVAIVVPDVEVLKAWAAENNIPGTLTVLCNNAEVKNLILNDMVSLGKEYGLKSFEQVSIFTCRIDNKLTIDSVLGKRHLPSSRSVFGAEPVVDSDIQVTSATNSQLL